MNHKQAYRHEKAKEASGCSQEGGVVRSLTMSPEIVIAIVVRVVSGVRVTGETPLVVHVVVPVLEVVLRIREARAPQAHLHDLVL